MFPGVQSWIDSVRPVSQKIGKVCAIFAAGVYERLDRIAENTGERTRLDSFPIPLTFAAGETKQIEVPVGTSYRLRLISSDAVNVVTIRSGGQTMLVKFFANADSFDAGGVVITRGPGAAIEITASQAGGLTFHVERTSRDDALPGVSGDRHPDGIRTNAMALAIDQHFPGVLDLDGDPYDIGARRASGTYGAGEHAPVYETRGDVDV